MKIGDTVKIMTAPPGDEWLFDKEEGGDLTPGDTGVIKSIDAGDLPICVFFTDHNDFWFFNADNLEVVA